MRRRYGVEGQDKSLFLAVGLQKWHVARECKHQLVFQPHWQTTSPNYASDHGFLHLNQGWGSTKQPVLMGSGIARNLGAQPAPPEFC
jgi:hypothetical protein